MEKRQSTITVFLILLAIVVTSVVFIIGSNSQNFEKVSENERPLNIQTAPQIPPSKAEIIIKNGKFNTKSIGITRGDALTFTNKDLVDRSVIRKETSQTITFKANLTEKTIFQNTEKITFEMADSPAEVLVINVF